MVLVITTVVCYTIHCVLSIVLVLLNIEKHELVIS